MRFERISPITHEAASSALAMTPAEARAVTDRAAGAFPAWADMGPNARRAILGKAASALEARKDDFVKRDDGGDRRHGRMGHVQPHAGGGNDRERRRR